MVLKGQGPQSTESDLRMRAQWYKILLCSAICVQLPNRADISALIRKRSSLLLIVELEFCQVNLLLASSMSIKPFEIMNELNPLGIVGEWLLVFLSEGWRIALQSPATHAHFHLTVVADPRSCPIIHAFLEVLRVRKH